MALLYNMNNIHKIKYQNRSTHFYVFLYEWNDTGQPIQILYEKRVLILQP
jgi:hypothetical protein